MAWAVALVLGAPVAIAAALVLWVVVQGRTTLRALAMTKRVAIARAPVGGFGKVVGTVELAGEPLVAPLSLRPCVHYSLYVFDPVRGRTSGPPIRAERSTDFVVRDDSGRARVAMGEARVVLGRVLEPEDETRAVSYRRPRALADFLVERASSLRMERCHYFERVIAAGDTVAVLGEFARDEPAAGDDAPRAEGERALDTAATCVVRAPSGGEVLVSRYREAQR